MHIHILANYRVSHNEMWKVICVSWILIFKLDLVIRRWYWNPEIGKFPYLRVPEFRTTFKSNLTCKFLSLRLKLNFTFHYEIPCIKFLASQTFFWSFGISRNFVNMSFIRMIFRLFHGCQKVPVKRCFFFNFSWTLKVRKSMNMFLLSSIPPKKTSIFFSISA